MVLRRADTLALRNWNLTPIHVWHPATSVHVINWVAGLVGVACVAAVDFARLRGGMQVIYSILGVVGLGAWAYLFVSDLRAHDGGLVVRNYYKGFVIPWEDVESIVEGLNLEIHTHSGRRVEAIAIQQSGAARARGWGSLVKTVAGDVSQLLAQYQQDAKPSPQPGGESRTEVVYLLPPWWISVVCGLLLASMPVALILRAVM